MSLKESKQQGLGSETGSSLGSLEIPTTGAVLVLRGWGCFTVMVLITRGVALTSARTERDSSPIWRNVSPNQLRVRIEMSPCRASFPSILRIERMLEILRAEGILEL